MVDPTQLPAYIQLRYRESGAFDEMQADIRTATATAKTHFDSAFGEIGRTIDRALAAERNYAGSLDLGAARLREVANAQQARAIAADEVARATRLAADAEGDYSQQARAAIAASEAFAREQRQAAAAALSHAEAVEQVQMQLDRTASGTQRIIGANDNYTRSSRQVSQATGMASQQFADIAVQLASGQRASTAFAQQLPQLGFALQGLAGSTNRTHARIGALATALSGVGGVAVGLAAGALVDLVFSLGDTEDASDRTAGALDFQRTSTEDLTSAIFDNLEAQRQGIALSYQSAAAARDVAAENLNQAITEREKTKALLEGYQASQRINAGRGTGGTAGAGAGLLANATDADIAAQDANIVALEESLRLAQVPLSRREAAAATDEAAAATLRYENAEAALTEQFRNGAIELAEFNERLTQLYSDRERTSEALRSNRRSGGRRSGRSTADREARELKQLAEFGEKAAERVARIGEQFDAQPRLIDRVSQATRELDRIVADLEKRQPPGFEALIDQAEDARDTVQDALVQPYRDLEEASRQRLAVEQLIAEGRDDEARALEIIHRLERDVQGVSAERRRDVIDLVRYERERTEELRRQRELFDAQVDAITTAKTGLQDLLSGRSTDLFGDLKQSLADLQGARLFDQLFGGVFEQIESELRGQSPLDKATARLADEVDNASGSTNYLGNATETVAQRMLRATAPLAAVSGNVVPGAALPPPQILPNGTLVAYGQRSANDNEPQEIAQLSISELADRISAGIVGPMLDGFDDILGTTFMQGLEGALTGALSGYLQAGKVGAGIGGLKGLVEQYGESLFGHTNAESYAKILEDGLQGARTGAQTDALLDMLGIKSSGTGAAIGGAIGSFLPIPGGAIIGSVAGGLIGGIFGGGNRSAGAQVTQDGFTVGGKDKDNYGAANSLGGAVSGAIDKIADALDASIGNYFVTIGLRGDQYRVNTSGESLKFDKGAKGFGQDQEAAVRYAILDAIADGAIKGITDAEERLLKAGKDLDATLQDVLDFRGVFDRLKQIDDPVGYAIDQLNAEFENLIDVFTRAGASSEEFAELERLYGLERAKAIEEATARTSDALKQLLDDLTIGDSGLSLRTRQQNAEAAYNPLAERVAAGETSAYDDYAEAARNLLDIERQIFGSTQQYFDRFDEVSALTASRVASDANVTPLFEDRASPFDSAGRVKDAVESQTGQLVDRLDAMIANQIRQLQQGAGSAGRPVNSDVARVANF